MSMLLPDFHKKTLRSNVMLLLRSIGIPGFVDSSPPPVEKILALVKLAELNKIPLLYLQRLEKFGDEKVFKNHLLPLCSWHARTIDLIAFLAKLFSALNIDYTFFKTIKPFPFTPADVDVMLASPYDLRKAFKALRDKGFIQQTNDLYSLGMYSARHELNVDLQLEPCVSNMPYLSKSLLFQHVIEREFKGFKVRTLDACAEIVAITSHSLYKEHMFTLNDYYAITLFSEDVNPSDLIELAFKTCSTTTVLVSFTLANLITMKAFGVDLQPVKRLMNKLCNSILIAPLLPRGTSFKMPYKYPVLPALIALTEKVTRDKYARTSILRALGGLRMHKLLIHFSRESY